MKKLLYLQHVPHESLGMILDWAQGRGILCERVCLFKGESLPSVDGYDFAVVMGGSMGVYDDDAHPWLKEEKRFLAEALHRRIPLLGICLGAQLLAHALGAKVTRNRFSEIGYFPVMLTLEAGELMLFNGLPRIFTPLHWHNDTFGIPNGSVHIASSDAAVNQGFIGPGPVLALQFHLEADETLASSWVDGPDAGSLSQAEKSNGGFIQTGEQLLASARHFTNANRRILFTLLDRFFLDMDRPCDSDD